MTSAIVVGAKAGGGSRRVYNKPPSEERHLHTRSWRRNKSMIQRGLIILIAGEALFIIGVILAVVWGVQLAGTVATAFQFERASLINRVSIEPGSSVEAARTQVTDISKPITVAIHIQRLGEREEAGEGDDGLGQRLQERLQQQQQLLPREQREARLVETVIDPSGTVVSNNNFSANLFTTFQPQNTGEHILNITNAGARNVTVYGIFGHMPVLTAASTFAEGGGRPELFDISLSTFSLVIAGGILMVIGFITIIAGTMIAVIDSRKGRMQKSGGSSSGGGGVTEGGVTYRKD